MEKIAFRKIRDFGQTISTATAFIQQNFWVLVKSICLSALPLILFGMLGQTLCYTWGMSYLWDAEQGSPTNGLGEMGNSLGYLMMSYAFLPFTMCGQIAALAIIYEYMRLYYHREDYYNISPREVVKATWSNAGVYFGTFVLLYVLAFLLMVPIFLLVAFGAALFVTSMSYVGGELGSGIGVILCAIALTVFFAYIMTAISFVFIVRIVEQTNFFEALSRSFKLIKGNFFSTIGLYIITMFITFSILGVPSVVAGASFGAVAFLSYTSSTLFVIIANIIYSVVYVVGIALSTLVSSFRYFSIVETKEGIGMLQKIERIGKSEASLQTA